MKNVSLREAIFLAIMSEQEVFGRQLWLSYKERIKEKMPLGSLYTTLDRMEKKKLVTSRMGAPNPLYGGNNRRFFSVTKSGREALRAVREALNKNFLSLT